MNESLSGVAPASVMKFWEDNCEQLVQQRDVARAEVARLRSVLLDLKAIALTAGATQDDVLRVVLDALKETR